MIGLFSAGIARLENLDTFLGEPWMLVRPWSPRMCDKVAGWGMRPTADKARRYAKRHGLPFLMLEDGFLRSVGLGKADPSLSMVMDESGIYYDASTASRLESFVKRSLTAGEEARSCRLLKLWRSERVSKYNHNRDYCGLLPARYVLVIDQTEGDVSIRHGMADASSFHKMLNAAIEENPGSTILLKMHPEVMAGRKRGHFELAALAEYDCVRIMTDDAHPVSLIENAEAIYVVTSQMGFEGLLWGKQVRTFGMPFYAGWGLTADDLSPPARRVPVPLGNLVHAALAAYPRYVHPETGQRCEAEAAIEWLGMQRRLRERFPARIYGLGFSILKKPVVRDFFQGSSVVFVNTVRKVPANATLAVWGRQAVPLGYLNVGLPGNGVQEAGAFGLKQQLMSAEGNLLRLEDGFIRSVGLGAEWVRPLSWVIDPEGIYYDALAPSRLESLLSDTAFDESLIARAASLRQVICVAGVTKYNVGDETWKRPTTAGRVILVPGQVETDASVRFGTVDIRRNLDLLKAVRAAHSEDYIVYKPHPDVRAALRRPGEDESEAGRWCNEVVGNVSFDCMLEQVDEVHVLTSLGGFEALMRGKQVVCYGQPFYSGWGLTNDLIPNARRQRRLTLDELVAATLILYPTYVSRVTGKFTTPERALHELMVWRHEPDSLGASWRRLAARVLRKD